MQQETRSQRCVMAVLLGLIMSMTPATPQADDWTALGFKDRAATSPKHLLREWNKQEMRRARVQALFAAPSRGKSRSKPADLTIVTVRSRQQKTVLSLQPVSGAIAARRARFAALIEAEATRQGIPPELVHAVIRAESAYHPQARSPAGACGLMQLMPGTAARFNVRDIWDPAENIRGGTRYLRWLLDHFNGDLRLALAGYNAGENAVKRYGKRIPPYRETRDYVAKVFTYLGISDA